MASKKARSLAAKRGWATRRANEVRLGEPSNVFATTRYSSESSKRSLAAKKVWYYRRVAKKERSDRAKRGWKTRRKNERQKENKRKRNDKLSNRKRSTPSRTSDERRIRDARKIQSIAEWDALDFSDTEEVEIVSNADY